MGTLVNTYYEQLLVFKNVLIDAATDISIKIYVFITRVNSIMTYLL